MSNIKRGQLPLTSLKLPVSNVSPRRMDQRNAVYLSPLEAGGGSSSNFLSALGVTTVEELLALDFTLGTQDLLASCPSEDEAKILRSTLKESRKRAPKAVVGRFLRDSIRNRRQPTSDLGDRNNLPDGLEIDPAPPSMANGLPESISLLELGMPPIRDQGSRGTCAAFATVAAIEFQLMRADPKKYGDIDLSEQLHFWDCKKQDGLGHVDGTLLTVAAALARKRGMHPREIWPYVPHSEPGETPGHVFPRESERAGGGWDTYRARKAVLLEHHDKIHALKESLVNEVPVIVGFPWFRSWAENPFVERTGNIHLPPVAVDKADAARNHAVLIVGYQNSSALLGGGYFVFRNSWGEKWGREGIRAGYGTLPFAFAEKFFKIALTLHLDKP